MEKTFTCTECCTEKPHSDYYKHPQTKDGISHRCKECMLKGRKTDHELAMARIRDRKRFVNNKERRKYVIEHSNYLRKTKGYGKTHLKTARKISVLGIRPISCPICNKEHSRIEAHHFDYTQWNKIIFACKICHSKLDMGKIDYRTCNIIDLLEHETQCQKTVGENSIGAG